MNTLALAVMTAVDKPATVEETRPGYLALLIVILMCVATYFLLRSFVKHTHKASEPWEGDSTGTKGP